MKCYVMWKMNANMFISIFASHLEQVTQVSHKHSHYVINTSRMFWIQIRLDQVKAENTTYNKN